MLVVNRLTPPGGIKKLFLFLESVQVITVDGREIVYRIPPPVIAPPVIAPPVSADELREIGRKEWNAGEK